MAINKGGRPVVDPKKKLSGRISIRVTESQLLLLRAEAKAINKHMTTYLTERLVHQNVHFTVRKMIGIKPMQEVFRLGSALNQVAKEINEIKAKLGDSFDAEPTNKIIYSIYECYQRMLSIEKTDDEYKKEGLKNIARENKYKNDFKKEMVAVALAVLKRNPDHSPLEIVNKAIQEEMGRRNRHDDPWKVWVRFSNNEEVYKVMLAVVAIKNDEIKS